MYHEHFFEPRFCDPSDRASYTPDICAELGEPAPDVQSDYRAAALSRLRVLLAIDAYMTDAENPRLAWTVCSIVFHLTSVRNLSLAEIANQLGVSASTVGRATAEFKKMAGLEVRRRRRISPVRVTPTDRARWKCGAQRLNSRDWPTSPGGVFLFRSNDK